MDANEILLIEDNADDEMLMLDALRRCGANVQVVVARDGAEALAYLLPKQTLPDQPRLPRLVLLDLKLPKVNGLEVLRRLRAEERTRYLPVVVLSSSSEAEDIKNSYAHGANAYVRKLIDFQQFMNAVRSMETFWLRCNETV